MKNITGIFLLLFLLLQSCTIYHKTSVPLAEATNQGKVKVVDGEGQKYVYKNIELRDGVYYGVRPKTTTELPTQEPLEIYIKDKKKSKITTLIVAVGIPAALGVFIGISLNNLSINLGGG